MVINMQAKKVGIMGGTFNPIHIGHLILAETARTQYKLEKILFIPSGQSYMKQGTKILPGLVRAEMTALAIEDNSFFSLSLMEIDRPGNTYTYATLETLKLANPDTEYYFILGADSLAALENWKCPQRLFDSCTILAAIRDTQDELQIQERISALSDKYGARILPITCGQMDISSTRIREMVKNKQSVRYLVPDKVLQYLEDHDLYREASEF